MKTSPYKTRSYNTLITTWTHPDADQHFITIGKKDKESGQAALSHMTGGARPKLLAGVESYASDAALKKLPEYEG